MEEVSNESCHAMGGRKERGLYLQGDKEFGGIS